MTKRDGRKPGQAGDVAAPLREAFRAIEAQPAPDRLLAHLEALASTARKDRRS